MDTSITVCVARFLFIISHWTQVFKWLFNCFQDCDVEMRHSSEHLREYSSEPGATCGCMRVHVQHSMSNASGTFAKKDSTCYLREYKACTGTGMSLNVWVRETERLWQSQKGFFSCFNMFKYFFKLIWLHLYIKISSSDGMALSFCSRKNGMLYLLTGVRSKL